MKLKHTKVATLAATLITFGSLAGGANGALSIDITEQGGNVVATLSGSYSNINGLTLGTSTSNAFAGGTDPVDPDLFINPVSSVISQGYTGFNISGVLGSGTSFSQADSATGTVSYVGFHNNQLRLPQGQSSGSLSASATWNGETFNSLGLTDGNVVRINWDSGNESLTYRVGSAVPEPSSALLLGLGSLGLLARRRRIQ